MRAPPPAGGTRTCIHTPGANLEPSELSPAVVASLLSGAALVYFDGRLTEAALVVAAAARAGGIPVLVEAERLRPNLERLLEYADYVVTSAHFPQARSYGACILLHGSNGLAEMVCLGAMYAMHGEKELQVSQLRLATSSNAPSFWQCLWRCAHFVAAINSSNDYI